MWQYCDLVLFEEGIDREALMAAGEGVGRMDVPVADEAECHGSDLVDDMRGGRPHKVTRTGGMMRACWRRGLWSHMHCRGRRCQGDNKVWRWRICKSRRAWKPWLVMAPSNM
ncbi:hypothetical protein E2542_SST21721 [Spatholobus suberectus]|nr:hypothetical protein E2542_SST21721 [Spatholobus suberectus]